jgi:internalin A
MKPQLPPPQAPDTQQFIDIGNNHTLLRYFQNIERKFRYATNLGLAIDDDDRSASGDKAVYLRELFVVPKLGSQYLSPELVIQAEDNPQLDQTKDLIDVIKSNQRLCILGDPGTGKSTLTQWLTLALSYSGENLTKLALGELVPFVLVLRDLPLTKATNWQELWQIFLEHNKQSLTQCLLDDEAGVVSRLFSSGQALVLLDGLDEITDDKLRRQLASVVWQAISEFPRCRFIITSRVIGFNQLEWFGLRDPDSEQSWDTYLQHGELFSKDSKFIKKYINTLTLPEESSFIGYFQDTPDTIAVKSTLIDHLIAKPVNTVGLDYWRSLEHWIEQQKPPFVEHYLSPFDNNQLQRFVRNWYQQYIPNAQDYSQRIDDLLKRLKLHDGLGHLARIPVLLNMICFIHARRGRLPDGRAELYQRIAETYLVSLDKARGINFKGQELNFDYHDLCQWLGKIAWELQNRRTEQDSSMLMTAGEVKQILSACLADHSFSIEERDRNCNDVLDYLKKRSGLLIPRGSVDGEDHYGFAHLSFMEYFAAYHLEQEAPFYVESDWNTLKNKAALAWWHETLSLFFECQTNARLAEKYLHTLFPELSNKIGGFEVKIDVAQLQTPLADIVLDTSVRLPQATREKIINILWGLLEIKGNKDREILPIYSKLATNLWQNKFVPPPASITKLYLQGAAISDLQVLSDLKNLKILSLDNTQVSDLQALAGLTNLQVLSLDNTQVSDLQALAGLTDLQSLALSNSQVSDLQALAGLTNLQALFLHNTQVSDLHALAGLTDLQALFLYNTQVSDLQVLAGLTDLQTLFLHNTQVSDLQALAGLTNLQTLFLHNTQVSDLQALAGLTNLQVLSLDNTPVSDLQALVGLTDLQKLSLSNTQVSEDKVTRLKQHLPNLYILK